tara:strand:+ start:142 stop:975 length:834 start_codon:yes stop_codon:yes gene_type:complete
MRKQKVVVDWHNLSYTIAEQKKRSSLISYLLKTTEKKAAITFKYQICVSKAMQVWFDYHWNAKHLMHFPDGPFESFRSIDDVNQAASILTQFIPSLEWSSDDRPIVCLTSTSWTEDERFDILWDALTMYDKRFLDCDIHLYMLITGKGPKKAEFEKKLMFHPFSHVQVLTLWLNYEDYTKLVRSVDVGLSLHDSTSGLDLPMKILDMLGSNIPVIAKNSMCIGELINSTNGAIFETAEDLFFTLYSTHLKKWQRMKQFIKTPSTFLDNWQTTCAQLF